MSNVERELKVVPSDDGLLDRLAVVDHLGTLRVVGRRVERQHNAFFDTSSRSFAVARVGFRRRTIEGQLMAIWTIKGEASAPLRGVSSRDEVELSLGPELPPALAISALRQAASSRGARALAEAVAEALRVGGLPLAEPYLETLTERRIVDLSDDLTAVELALDRMRVVGHDYAEVEIEAELKDGDERVLDEVRTAIQSLGDVRESHGSKLARAMSHLETCDCSGREGAG